MLLLAAALVAVVIATLALPFVGGTGADDDTEPSPIGREADEQQELIDLELEREILLSSLAELEVDRVRNKLETADYDRLKAADEQRLLRVLDRLETLGRRQPAAAPATAASARASHSWAVVLVIALFVIGGGSGLYWRFFSLQQAQVIARQQQTPPGMPDPKEMVARLEAKLKDNPNDLQGQIMLGRSYMVLDRMGDAQKTWAKVLELDPKNAEAHFNTGVILISTRTSDDPALYQQALDHFDIAYVKLPQEPALLWYRGLAQAHLKRLAEADASWTAAYQNLDPGSQDAVFVQKALQQLRTGKPPAF